MRRMDKTIANEIRSLVKLSLSVLLASILLAGASRANEEADDRAALLERQQLLLQKITALKHEQDYLRFQQTMLAVDSKYLVLNIAARTGQLRYKNRVLMDFPLSAVSRKASLLHPGAVMLTGKQENPKRKNILFFGDMFILQGKQAPLSEDARKLPRIVLIKKDFLSVFYAVEAGAWAYIAP